MCACSTSPYYNNNTPRRCPIDGWYNKAWVGPVDVFFSVGLKKAGQSSQENGLACLFVRDVARGETFGREREGTRAGVGGAFAQ